jgi:hypothetical protein
MVIAPGAGHSGYEDHFQADAAHYIHHRDFEYNYAGGGANFLDIWFGTFRGSLQEKAGSKEGGRGLVQPADAKSTLRSWPGFDFLLYMLAAVGSLAAWAYVAVIDRTAGRAHPLLWSCLAGFGPLLLAVVFGWGKAGGRRLLEGGVQPAAVLLSIGSLVCCVPITWACYLAVA